MDMIKLNNNRLLKKSDFLCPVSPDSIGEILPGALFYRGINGLD